MASIRRLCVRAAAAALIGFAAISAYGQTLLSREGSPFALSLEYETGFLKVLSHTYQVGESGTNFDFVNQGGQEILFPFERFSARLDAASRHRLEVLYQPLVLETTVRTRADVVVDGRTFLTDTELDLKYGFPFWRGTYSYLWRPTRGLVFGTGFALQLRNASIVFAAADGSEIAVSQNLGPVPALHFSLDWRGAGALSVYIEATGSYASSALFNGADFDFEGSLLDASIRPRLALRNGLEAFLNFRFLGGSAKGTSGYASTQWSVSSERYTANYLATMSVTAGLALR